MIRFDRLLYGLGVCAFLAAVLIDPRDMIGRPDTNDGDPHISTVIEMCRGSGSWTLTPQCQQAFTDSLAAVTLAAVALIFMLLGKWINKGYRRANPQHPKLTGHLRLDRLLRWGGAGTRDR